MGDESLTSIRFEPFTSDMADDVVHLLQRELHADPITQETFSLKVLLDPNFREDLAVTAKVDGKVVGFMLGIIRRHPLEDAPFDGDKSWITLMAVDSEYQRTGIGSAMLDMVIDSMRVNHTRSVWVSPYAPNYFTPGIDEHAYPNAIRFLEKHGFRTAFRPLSMEANLVEFHIPDWVSDKAYRLAEDGCTILAPGRECPPRHSAIKDSLTQFLKTEFPGDWQRIIREAMESEDESRNPGSCISVMMKDGVCVGFAHNDGDRFGPFGVAASERGRGLGAVLLSSRLESMLRQGFVRAWFMWTNDQTARLYARFGFQETRRFAVMTREL
ncbi:MAG: GNAT family N-acetyltransferase [Armatimonadota bacterium]